MHNRERPSGRQLVSLKNQVVKGFNESHWRELGAITECLDAVSSHPRLLRSLNWGDPDYEGHALEMLSDMFDASPDNHALILDYIDRTCPEGGEFVSSVDSGGRRIVFSPSVFNVPPEATDPNLISVMMPFSREMSPVYDTIKSASFSCGLTCLCADDIWDDSTVIQDVFGLIFRSYIVVCDFTGRNPNVFYEAGIAHTLGKHVVSITQIADDISFDLRHHRYAQYLNNAEGRSVLQADHENRIRNLNAKRGI